VNVDTLVIVVLVASACVTAYIWTRIYASVDPAPMKIALAVAVAIPIIGPLFWPFLSMPPRTREGIWSAPFQGLPREPRWAAIALRIGLGLIALVVVVVHAAVLRQILK